MRKLLLGAAAIALSGCSWNGASNQQSGYYGQQQQGDYYAPQQAQPCCELSRWNLEGAIGPAFIIGGDAITGDNTNKFPGEVVGNNVSMKDVYDTGMRYELGGSYALNPNRKLTVLGHYANAKGGDVNLGSIDLADIEGDSFTGELDDYKRYGVEAGLRQYFQIMPVGNNGGSIRPYVEGRLGASHVKDIDLNNAAIGDTAEDPATIPFYKGGWVPTAAGLVGVETPIFNRTTIGLETGIRYTGKPDTGVAGNGLNQFGPFGELNGVNNGGSSWSVPVMLRGRYRF